MISHNFFLTNTSISYVLRYNQNPRKGLKIHFQAMYWTCCSKQNPLLDLDLNYLSTRTCKLAIQSACRQRCISCDNPRRSPLFILDCVYLKRTQGKQFDVSQDFKFIIWVRILKTRWGCGTKSQKFNGGVTGPPPSRCREGR
jgi:hypothetical protein